MAEKRINIKKVGGGYIVTTTTEKKNRDGFNTFDDKDEVFTSHSDMIDHVTKSSK